MGETRPGVEGNVADATVALRATDVAAAAVTGLDPESVLPILWQQSGARAGNQIDLLLDQCRRALARGARLLALDAVLLAEALAPERMDAYVAHVELALVLGRPRVADALLTRLSHLASLDPERVDPIDLRRLRLHRQANADELLAFARELLTLGRSDLWPAYLPAIVATLRRAGLGKDALALAKAWHTASGSSSAWWTLASQVLDSGDAAHAASLLAALPRRPQDARQWAVVLGLAALVDREALAWLRQAVTDVRAHRLAAAELDQELAMLAHGTPWSRRTDVLRATVWLAAGEPHQALDLVAGLESGGAGAMRLLEHAVAAWAALALARPAEALPHLQAVFDTLVESPELSGELDGLLTPPVTVESAGERLAELLEQSGQVAEATEVLGRLVERTPGHAPLVYRLARVLASAGRGEEARAALYALIREQHGRRDTRGRLETLRHLVLLSPGDASALDELITGYTRLGMMDEAIGLLRQLAADAGRANRIGEAVTFLRRAADLAMLGHRWDAIPTIYEQMIELDPENLDHRHAAVTAFVQTGQVTQAIEQLRQIVRVALGRGEPEIALAALHQMVALDPRNPDVYHRLAELLVSLGELEQAERVYRRLLVTFPDDTVAKTKQAALAALLKAQDGS